MVKTKLLLIAGLALATGACTTGNYRTDRQVACAGGVLGGAAIGGLLGNQIGGGSGKSVATAVGAGVGAAAGTRAPACR